MDATCTGPTTAAARSRARISTARTWRSDSSREPTSRLASPWTAGTFTGRTPASIPAAARSAGRTSTAPASTSTSQGGQPDRRARGRYRLCLLDPSLLEPRLHKRRRCDRARQPRRLARREAFHRCFEQARRRFRERPVHLLVEQRRRRDRARDQRRHRRRSAVPDTEARPARKRTRRDRRRRPARLSQKA